MNPTDGKRMARKWNGMQSTSVFVCVWDFHFPSTIHPIRYSTFAIRIPLRRKKSVRFSAIEQSVLFQKFRLHHATQKSIYVVVCYFFQEAKEVLTTPEKKLMYDKWKNSGIQISYKQWLGMKEHVQQVFTINVFVLC